MHSEGRPYPEGMTPPQFITPQNTPFYTEARCRWDTTEEIQGYHDLLDEQRDLCSKFMDQPWVKAIAKQRVIDNENKVSVIGRKYVVTEEQYVLTQRFWREYDQPRLNGYDLVKDTDG